MMALALIGIAMVAPELAGAIAVGAAIGGAVNGAAYAYGCVTGHECSAGGFGATVFEGSVLGGVAGGMMGAAFGALGDEAEGTGAFDAGDYGPFSGYRYPETKGLPVKASEGTTPWEDFLGDGPYTNIHPRTGLPDPGRIVSADGSRSIRFGTHEVGTDPIHYHEETWGDLGWGYEALHNVTRDVVR